MVERGSHFTFSTGCNVSLLTSAELVSLLPGMTSERERFDLAAGMSAALERATNRVFAKRVSLAVTEEDFTEITIPRHGWAAGDRIRLFALDPESDWDGIFQIASVTGPDRFKISLTPETPLSASGEVTARRVQRAEVSTSGGSRLFLHPRPVAEVVSVQLMNHLGGYEDPLESNLVVLADTTQGVSLSGEVVLRGIRLPENRSGSYRDGRSVAGGALVEFVAGEPIVPADLIHAAKQAIQEVPKRQKRGGKSSERYDYYSYSMMSAAELSEYFGELHSIIRSLRLAAA